MAKRSRRAESRCRYYVREEAMRRGWDTQHIARGGDALEEQEIEEHFSDVGLKGERPDFLFCLSSNPTIVVEAKNEAGKLVTALDEAITYANTINITGKYLIRFAVGAAGEEDEGFEIAIRFLSKAGWVPLTSHGYELTNFPSKKEIELALEADDGSTNVSIPSVTDFIDSAIEVSQILRTAKVEAPLRPKVVGAIVLAMYEGDISPAPEKSLESVNILTSQAITESVGMNEAVKNQLIDVLHLSGADFNRLSPYIGRIINILRRLNIRSVIHTDADFLGMFYEAFLRYGYDNNALGIVFTPRHITRMCVHLTGVEPRDRVIDIACGTGGFLVSAYDVMMSKATSDAVIAKVKDSFAGFDTNPTVWALAMLNMFFRGDGKSHISNSDCFDTATFAAVRGKYTRTYLNPPFSQQGEPERRFIDQAIEAIEPEGMLAAVVKAGIFADDEHRNWRQQFLKYHRLLAVISLPEDIFYPTAAPTSIIIAQAHIPMAEHDKVFLARVWYDGFEKLKGRRIERGLNQIPEIIEEYHKFLHGLPITSPLATSVEGRQLKNGTEWSPQEWLPQPLIITDRELNNLQRSTMRSIFQAVSVMPDLSASVIDTFAGNWQSLPSLPLNEEDELYRFFHVYNGKSVGEKNYSEGVYPYISSGDLNNSVIRLVDAEPQEIFPYGAITVTAFGLANVQPWAFVARGNGGSSVRVLIPKYQMSLRELIWFASQINSQRWRFFYARMAIKGRLARLKVRTPPTYLPDSGQSIAERALIYKTALDDLSRI